MKRLHIIVTHFAFFVLPIFAAAQDAHLPPAEIAAVDQAAAAQIEKQKAIGLALGVIQHGKIAYLKAYGLSDREKQTPTTTQTVFNWASNSKPVAAILAMQLVEAKALDLDADVRTYVP